LRVKQRSLPPALAELFLGLVYIRA